MLVISHLPVEGGHRVRGHLGVQLLQQQSCVDKGPDVGISHLFYFPVYLDRRHLVSTDIQDNAPYQTCITYVFALAGTFGLAALYLFHLSAYRDLKNCGGV